jgi:tRNA A37 methylthiotransferase MiaB
MRNQVPPQVARERNRVLSELAANKKLEFMRSFLGKTLPAITLNVFDGQYTEALTDNYLKLQVTGRREANQWITVHVTNVQNETLVGLVKEDHSICGTVGGPAHLYNAAPWK